MGSGKIFECPECGNRVELYEGIGMMWSHFDTSMFYPPKKGSCELNFYGEINKKIIKEAQKFIEDSEIARVVDAYLQPYICEKCGKFTTKLYFRIESENGTYRPKYFCRCGRKYRRLTKKDEKHLYCAKCGCEFPEPKTLYWD